MIEDIRVYNGANMNNRGDGQLTNDAARRRRGLTLGVAKTRRAPTSKGARKEFSRVNPPTPSVGDSTDDNSTSQYRIGGSDRESGEPANQCKSSHQS